MGAATMKYHNLTNSNLKIPVLMLGTATFGGGNEIFRKWGETDVKEASSMVDVALAAGCNMFDTADSYSAGLSEEILGQAIAGRRGRVLIATKTGMRMGDGPGNIGTGGERIIRSCEASLRRLGTDVIDLYQLHAFDALTPIDEMLRALDTLITDGKIRCFGVSNYSGWHLMKMIALAERHGLPRPVAHQIYYSLVEREFEWELMPLALDQKIDTLVWSPLSGAQLGGKVGRHKTPPKDSRAATNAAWPVDTARLYAVTDVLEQLSSETGHSIPRLALAWLLSRPSVGSIVIGARNTVQLADNLAAVQVALSVEQIQLLDRASMVRPVYPYWHQRATYAQRNPPPV
jgi:aryl-alcohol dehydrogenase-like predicted oxidoreductase